MSCYSGHFYGVSARISALFSGPAMVTVLIYALLPILCVLSLFIGRYEVPPHHVLHILATPIISLLPTEIFPASGYSMTLQEQNVIYQIRLPRVLAAVLVGAGLSIAGASYQGLFKNPLVSPDILGVASGAGFGAALAILISAGSFTIQLSAFCFGIIAVAVTYLLSRSYRRNQTLILLLSGIIVGDHGFIRQSTRIRSGNRSLQ